ncbi:MAG: hypothetical protein BGO51_15670 [Rhodospirillales bacterium 69-11]|nr:MAG: hypothetical protein BGO51_15670 [Rhodospirillales bacterium 69-11]
MIRDNTSDRTATDFAQTTAASVRVSARRTPPIEIPFMQRPTCTIKEACKAAGMGRTKFYELIKGGVIKITPVGRRRLVQVPSLLKFLKIAIDDGQYTGTEKL